MLDRQTKNSPGFFSLEENRTGSNKNTKSCHSYIKVIFLFLGRPIFLIPIRMFRTSRVGPIFEIRVFRINIMCLRYRNEIRHRNINSKWISSFTINVISIITRTDKRCVSISCCLMLGQMHFRPVLLICSISYDNIRIIHLQILFIERSLVERSGYRIGTHFPFNSLFDTPDSLTSSELSALFPKNCIIRLVKTPISSAPTFPM